MIRLRQIAIVTRNLEAAEAEIADKLDIEPCYQDPSVAGHGLRNIVFPIGDQFLELVTPTHDNTPAARQLTKRGIDYLYMALFHTDHLEPVKVRLAQNNVRSVVDTETKGVQGLHLHPKDVPGTIVSIDTTDNPAEWPWAGPTWRDHVRTDTVSAIRGLTISTKDPSATSAKWSMALGKPSITTAKGLQINLDRSFVYFDETSGDDEPGVTEIQFSTPRSNLAGTKIDMLDLKFEFAGD